jgi:hypothetical protein
MHDVILICVSAFTFRKSESEPPLISEAMFARLIPEFSEFGPGRMKRRSILRLRVKSGVYSDQRDPRNAHVVQKSTSHCQGKRIEEECCQSRKLEGRGKHIIWSERECDNENKERSRDSWMLNSLSHEYMRALNLSLDNACSSSLEW